MAASQIVVNDRKRAQQRRETWGDLAQRVGITDSQYPRTSGLQALLQSLSQNVLCNPTTNHPLDPDLQERLEALRIPQDHKCLAAAAITAQKQVEESKQQDKRSRESLETLHRTARAKKHLDRARQMYAFALALMQKGVDQLRVAETQADVVQQNRLRREGRAMLKRAQYLVSSTEEGKSQTPAANKKSALRELYEAYKLIRDYEMNPLPPLLAGDRVNPMRVAEDQIYAAIMGSDRLEPNRLGIGQSARAVWLRAGYHDPNLYVQAQGNAADPQLQPLYSNVGSATRLGPQQWVAYQDYMASKMGTVKYATRADVDVSAMQAEGYWPRRLTTDSSRALTNIHANFFSPLPTGNWQQQRGSNVEPPPPVQWLPYAVPGEPNDNPRWRGRPAQYYPTGPPELGVPDTSQGYWDARVACNMLQSHTEHITAELSQCKSRQEEPQANVSVRTMWPDGPAFSPARRTQ